ncbi:MAG TPA: hypothetical protein VFQ58_04890, partial [Flavisolibacter sp.]|nr:hypothetical protein [Flavisolibacter sp.]
MKQTLTLIGLALLLFSCQKEPINSLASRQTRDSTLSIGKLLTWIKYNNSGDTGSTNFIYDGNKQLSIIQNFRKAKLYSGNYTQIVRYNDGMIEAFVQDVGTLDSLYTSLYEDNGKYLYAYQLNTT